MEVDADTLERARRGEPAARRAIAERFAADVLARVGGDEAAAQAVLAAVLADLPRYALGADKLAAWVTTRAARVARERGAGERGAGERGGAGEPPAAIEPAIVTRLVEHAVAAVPAPRELAAPARRPVRPGVVAAVVSLACVAALVIAFVRTTPPARGAVRGDLVATARASVAIARGVAVVEAGGAIHWDGSRVDQPVGNVFYRIERGGTVTVTTPHGTVTTTSACLRIEVGAGSTAVTIDEGDAVVGARPAAAGARVVLP